MPPRRAPRRPAGSRSSRSSASPGCCAGRGGRELGVERLLRARRLAFSSPRPSSPLRPRPAPAAASCARPRSPQRGCSPPVAPVAPRRPPARRRRWRRVARPRRSTAFAGGAPGMWAMALIAMSHQRRRQPRVAELRRDHLARCSPRSRGTGRAPRPSPRSKPVVWASTYEYVDGKYARGSGPVKFRLNVPSPRPVA